MRFKPCSCKTNISTRSSFFALPITSRISLSKTSGLSSFCSMASDKKASIGSTSRFCSTTSPTRLSTKAVFSGTCICSSPLDITAMKPNNSIKNTRFTTTERVRVNTRHSEEKIRFIMLGLLFIYIS